MIEGELLEREDDVSTQIDAEPDDTIEDLIVKTSLSVSGLEPSKVQMFFKNASLEKDSKFIKLRYQTGELIYMKKISSSCTCFIF